MSDKPVIRIRTRVRPQLECAESIDGTAPETDLGTQANNTSPNTETDTESTNRTSVAANKTKVVGGDYEVGYCKPPTKNQFPKNTSGNLTGRPKKSRNRKSIFREVVQRPIKYKRDGKLVNTTRWEVMFEQLCIKALKGDVKAFVTLDKLWREDFSASEAADDDNGSAAGNSRPLSDNDRSAFAFTFRQKLAAEGLDDNSIRLALRAAGLGAPEADFDEDAA